VLALSSVRHAAVVTVLAASAIAACSDEDTRVTRAAICTPPPKPVESAVALAPAVSGQTFRQPIEVALGPSGRFYVLEQKGVVRVVDVAGTSPASTAIDISRAIVAGGEAGLLGIAFDPAFAETGHVYLHFTAPLPEKRDGVVFQSVVARFTSTDGGATLDPKSEKRILAVDQPFANHNGGKIAFGPDGLLYIALGDGGSGGDPRGNGQNRDSLLGKILRIDPRGADPYGIPADNPFARGGGRPEIYALGLRNPWKMSFDTATGELWCGDVGQSKHEEIDLVTRGGNYGWNTREGKHCYGAETCATEGFIDPVVEYGRSEGVSITAGYVYRGKKVPSLVGKLVFGDFGSGNVWAVDKDASGAYVPRLLVRTDLKISTFAQDADGEVYVVDYASGRIEQLVPGEAVTEVQGLAGLLSGTGCVDPQDPTKAPPGLVPYTVNSPLWSDGADKARSLFVPAGAKIAVGPDGDFDVPPGSVAVKTFSSGDKRIETRLFVRYEDGSWAGYSYEWNDAQTDATLLATAKDKTLANGATWHFPSRAECFACHTPAAGYTLGLEVRQLDRNDEGGENQLARFAEHTTTPLTPGAFAPLAAADTPSVSDEQRARGYLHANCASCHREGAGAGAATFDLRIDKSFAETKTCNVRPQGGDVGGPDARLVVPGDPARSTLLLRMHAAAPGERMPPLARNVVDEAGVRAVRAWIAGLGPACP